MLKRIDKTMEQIAREINAIDNKEEVYDHQGGRGIRNKDHAKKSLWSSYHRIREIAKYIYRVGPAKKILDIGIGYGFLDIFLKQGFGLDITGMEIEENIRAYCPLVELHGIPIIPGRLSRKDCPIANNSFDIVILSEVIEHLRISPLKALSEIKRILKPGGQLLLTTPNMARLTNILRLLMGRNIIEEFPDDDRQLNHITDKMTHIREYTMKELKLLLGRAGFEIVEARYSLSHDKLGPGHSLNWKYKFMRVLLQPPVMLVPSLRSLILIVGQKTDGGIDQTENTHTAQKNSDILSISAGIL